MYIHQLISWPNFTWNEKELLPLLSNVRYKQGKLLGQIENWGFNLREEATLQNITEDVLKSSEIEGIALDAGQVRSSIARRLGIDAAGLVPSDRNTDGVVEMTLDATQRYKEELTIERFFGWHAALFPAGRSGMHKIVVGNWRTNAKDDPMQVVSGAMGRETVHYQAPDAEILDREMQQFVNWFNNVTDIDPVIKAGIAHFWFVTIHPFDDGNGRIARTLTDMQLARADGSAQRFYSMSARIRADRNAYYHILEKTQRGRLDITEWLIWFVLCFDGALTHTNQTLAAVLQKARFWDNPATASLNHRQKLMCNKLLDGFEGKLTSSKWAKIAKCSQDTAGRDIADLVTRGILVKEAAGGRSTSYVLNLF